MLPIKPGHGVLWLILIAAFPSQPAAGAADPVELPNPLAIVDVVRLAREHRDEVIAAQARYEAAGERPVIVSALEDPMLSYSVDHYPFDTMAAADAMSEGDRGGRYDWNYAIEQRFPLSGVRGHRRRAAEAEAATLRADVDRAARDVEFDAASAYLMLGERRRMIDVAREQAALASQLTSAAAARYAAGQAGQADLLRAEVESARASAQLNALRAEIRGAEAMLNAAIGRDTTLPVPPLVAADADRSPPSPADAIAIALERRPELQGGAAEIDRAAAETEVMRSMYRPMGMVRLGHASTMTEGQGLMVMLGVSLPVWRGSLAAGVREAEAMQRMARADLAAMRRMVEGEVVAARERIDAARVRFLALRDDVEPRARAAVQSSLGAYRSGQSDMVAVIDATRALWDTQGELVMAEADVGLAWARLERATGAAAASR
jgi:outer membrane protein, heavy metal efflux system